MGTMAYVNNNEHTITMPGQRALEAILDLDPEVPVSVEDMAKRITVVFYPREGRGVTDAVRDFSSRLKSVLIELGVSVVPVESAQITLPIRKLLKRSLRIVANNSRYLLAKLLGRATDDLVYLDMSAIRQSLSRKRFMRDVVIISLGDQDDGMLPIDQLSSFRQSSVVSLVELPSTISRDSSFTKHFDLAMSLFAHHMSHVIIGIGRDFWLLYNFNASHPSFDLDGDLKAPVRTALLPKLAAPIMPVQMREFTVLRKSFDCFDQKHKRFVDDLTYSGKELAATGLWPAGKHMRDLPFRSALHRWIGSLHLDKRNGMSYGFLARQLPTTLMPLLTEVEAQKRFGFLATEDQDWYVTSNALVIRLGVDGNRLYMQVPDVWVLTQRSGSDKTHMNPSRDLVKMGLKNGHLYLQLPVQLKVASGFRTSFDTKVILAHAVGNAIVASIGHHLDACDTFASQLMSNGMAISHWHGYLDSKNLPEGWHAYGMLNPHVACSSPQSALYALSGKLATFARVLSRSNHQYLGDVHIEPHHGSNIVFPSLTSLAEYLTHHPSTTALGNKYLDTWMD
jgi:hypothetical protein